MVRPVSLHINPPFFPNVCIRCGCGNGQRDFFIDLGINLTGYFNPMNEGDIYYCNECAPNLVTDINRLLTTWNRDHAPWDSPDRVESSYNWESDIDLSGIDNGTRNNKSTDSVESSSEGSSTRDNEGSSSSEQPDAVPESTVSELSSDEQLRDGIHISFGDD